RTDPLTQATRTTKRNLLAASVVAITFKAFDIVADKIPVAGMTITFDKGVFEFLLVMVLWYFLAAFVLYYYIDIENFPRTAHHESTDKWRKGEYEKFTKSVHEKFNDAVPLPSEDSRIIAKFAGTKRIDAWLDGAPSVLALSWRVWRRPLSERHVDLSGL